MENNKGKFYITTAIAYSSSKPHFGNTYEVIMTDAVARFKRQQGYDVFFLTGTDEHGQKIENAALAANISPKEYVDKISAQIKEIWDLVGASYDKFIRTTDDYHQKAVADIFKRLYDKGDIYRGEYEGWYCVPDEAFFTDSQLDDGNCPDCGRPVQRTKEEAYFLRMSKYQDALMKHINENPGFIEPEARKREMINNFLKPGLQDLCVSRTSFKWGIPVSFDEKHIIYVWIDALSNYITALGYGGEDDSLYKKYWPADAHIIGKDIIRFHTIYWPIILMALGEPLPKKVFGHPWFNFASDKMSKSRGNVIYADELVKYFGVDGVRHYALAEMPYSSDGNITYESILNRYNTDLANNLGNLVNRTVSMTKMYFDGVVPEPKDPQDIDRELKAAAGKAKADVLRYMESYHIADAVDSVFSMLRRANKYIDETMPWALAKEESTRARLGTVLYNLLETIRLSAVLLTPFIPATADKIFAQVGSSCRRYSFGGLESGISVGQPQPLFARLDEEKTLAEIKASLSEKEDEAEADKPETLPQITFDDFMGIELRTAEVIGCEPIPKAKKLLKLMLDLGYEKRQVVSGIAEFYSPDDLIGKKVVVVANLKPAVLRGVESNGMILASSADDGPVRVLFVDPQTPNGERVT